MGAWKVALCSSRRRDWASATRSRRSSVCRESREAERGPRAGRIGEGLRKVGRVGNWDWGRQGEVIRDWWS